MGDDPNATHPASGDAARPAGAGTAGGTLGQVLVASNRGPLSFDLGVDGELSARRGAGGLVSGLLPGLASVARRADVVWVCAALSEADRVAARQDPHGERFGVGAAGAGERRVAVRALDIPAETLHGAYDNVANTTLWFLHHLMFDTPTAPSFCAGFSRDWRRYVAYNETFAAALASTATEGSGRAADADAVEPVRGGRGDTARPPSARVLVQDYHLALVPRLLREAGVDTRVAHFSHTPWAPPAYFRILPDEVGRAILDGMLGADHAGFLSPRWADAFLDCCEVLLGARVERSPDHPDRRGRVSHRGRLTQVAVHPLGVDAAALRMRASAADVAAHLASLAEAVGDRQVIARVDRTELSKNILRGLDAYRELLRTRPGWRKRVVHLVLAYPSRGNVPGYREYTDAVRRAAEAIDAEFGTPDWRPLLLEVRDDYPRSLAACRIADVLLVNPIRDGMNLVAEEGPVLSDRDCALVLSREAGAADLLGADALLVNPYDVTATADALDQALSMSSGERGRRRAALAAAAAARHPGRWLAEQLDALG